MWCRTFHSSPASSRAKKHTYICTYIFTYVCMHVFAYISICFCFALKRGLILAQNSGISMYVITNMCMPMNVCGRTMCVCVCVCNDDVLALWRQTSLQPTHTHTHPNTKSSNTFTHSFALIQCECLINSNSSMTWGKRVWPASWRRPTYHSGENAHQRPISRKSIGRIFCTMTTAI